MLETIFWNKFEQTGDIDMYLQYKNYKNKTHSDTEYSEEICTDIYEIDKIIDRFV